MAELTVADFVFMTEVERYDAFLRLYHSAEQKDKRALAALLASKDPLVPLIMLQYLEDMPEQRAVHAVTHLIERGNEVVSRAAMRAYKGNHYPGKARVLKRLVFSRSERACRFAVRTLSRAGFIDCLPMILRELPERHGAVRAEMIAALRFLPDRRSVVALKPMAQDPDETTRVLAVQALAELQHRTRALGADFFIRLTHDRSERVRRAALEALQSFPTKKVAALLLEQALDPKEPDDARDRALRALSGFPSWRWVRPLAAFAASAESPSLRLAVEVCLRAYPPEELRKGLLPLLGDADIPVRHQAALYLADLCGQDPSVRARLTAVWKAADDRAAVDLVEVLRAMGGADSAALLREAMDRSPLVAYAAAGALARMHGTAHGPALLSVVKDTTVRATVRQAVFSHWAKRGPDPSLMAELEPVLLESLTSDVINIRYLSLQILAWFPLRNKLPYLLSVLAREPDPEVVRTVSKQIVVGLGRDPIPLVLALTVHPDRESLLGHMVRLLTDQNWDPRLATPLMDILREPPLDLLSRAPETYLTVCLHFLSYGALTLQDLWAAMPGPESRLLLLRLLASFMKDPRRRFPELPLDFLLEATSQADAQTRHLYRAVLAADGRVRSLEALVSSLLRETDETAQAAGRDLVRAFFAGAAA